MEYVVYVLGLILLGIFYYPLKTVTNGGVWFVLAVACYLLLLRLIGFGLKHLVFAKKDKLDS